VRLYIHYTIHDGEFNRCPYIHYTTLMTHGTHDDEFDRGAYIHTLHHAHAYGTHDEVFDRCAYIYTLLTPMV
jgi:hypothetical protein